MEQNRIQTDDEIEIDLKEIFFILWDKIWIIMLSTIGIALITLIVSKFMITPLYESTTKIYVLNRQETGTTTINDLQSSMQLTKDYQILVLSRPVTEQVIINLDLPYTSEELAKMITVNTPNDTRILEIKVENEDPYLAKNIADALADISAVRISEVMDIEKVNIVEGGNLPEFPKSPDVKKYTLIGALLGAFLTAGIIIIIYLLNDTIKDADDIEKYLGLSMLASIPVKETEKNNRKKKIIQDKKTLSKKGM